MATKPSRKPDTNLRVTFKNTLVIINASIPQKWLVISILILIAWQAPEFWKIIQTVIALIKP